MTIQRCQYFAEVERTLGNFCSQSICGSNHLTRTKSSTCQQSATDLWPVIAPGIGIDSRCSTKFSPGDDSDVLIHSTLMQVLDQGGQSLIKLRQMGVFHAVEVIAVKVPATEVQRDHATTGFDKPACHQKVFEVPRSPVAESTGVALAITFSDGRWFGRDIKGFHQSATGQNIEGLLRQGIHAFKCARAIHIPAQSINTGQKTATLIQPIAVDSLQLHVVTRRPGGTKSGMSDAEESRQSGRAIRGMPRIRRQSHERRHGSIYRAQAR